MIPYGHQSIGEEEIEAVVETLRSPWLTQGPKVRQFEEKLSAYCHAKHAVAVANGTCALHAACHALGVKQGDIIWTSPISFVASANCARYCGARVDFVDIDPDTRLISIDKLVKKLVKAKKENKLPKIIIPVHFAGNICDMPRITELAKEYNIKIIEDAAHAIGGEHHGFKVGQCQFSDIAIFSFHPVKTMTTGEGGAALTNSEELAQAMRLFASHGITRDEAQFSNTEEGGWYYEQQSLGYNFRMCDIQAALGCVQLDKLDAFVARRRELFERYCSKLGDQALKLPVEAEGVVSAWHLFVIEVLERDRKKVFEFLRQNDIGVNVHYIPIHFQPYYRNMGFCRGDFPNSENYYKGAISLPLYAGLKDQEQDYVVGKLIEAIQ